MTKHEIVKATDDDKARHAAILKTLTVACPRIRELELDGLEATITVGHFGDVDPKTTFEQRAFLQENGLTKLERATIDFLCLGELRNIAGGELSVKVKVAGT